MLTLLGFGLTIIVYFITKRFYRRFSFILFSPILTSLIVLVLILVLFHISYGTYNQSAIWLTELLKPATVAFAVPLYKHLSILKKHALEIFTGILAGVITAVTSSVILATVVHLNLPVINSLAPRSITTPIAMDVAKEIGGIPVMTAVFVILTALVGLIVAPILIRVLGIRSPLAQGTLYGTGAHGIGTSRAFEIGGLEGTISSLSMILAALFTLAVAPLGVPLLHEWLGMTT